LWWQRLGLNQRPRAYESPALPLSYAASKQKYSTNSIRLSMPFDDIISLVLKSTSVFGLVIQ
jgi:hypothetical protein